MNEIALQMAATRLQEIRERIARACEKVGRSPQEVTLIGASKTVPAARLADYVRAGLCDCGENYVQEASEKIATLANFSELRWHGIGALQRNKAREAVRNFTLIHSVDRFSLAREIDKWAREAGRVQNVLLQVNVADEGSKAGCTPHELPALWEQGVALENLRICGLMCLPPFQPEAEQSRPHFRLLRELAAPLWEQFGQSTCSDFASGVQLSMGMSHDFEIAIEEGATCIRVGTALFGARSGARENSQQK